MIRPIQPDSSTTAVWFFDPAVDLANTSPEKQKEYNERKYLNPSCYRDLLAFFEGRQITEFIIGVIPAAELSRIEDDCRIGKPDSRMHELQWRCFIHALRDIRGWGDGVKIPKVERHGIQYVDPEWIERCFVGPIRKAAIDIGGQAWNWNNVQEAEIKN